MDTEVAIEALRAIWNVQIVRDAGLQTEDSIGGAVQAEGASWMQEAKPAFFDFYSLLKPFSLDVDDISPESGPLLDIAGGRSVSIGKLLPINEDKFLDPTFNQDFTGVNDTLTYYRGGEEYKRPCGWYRYGLKVLNKYDDDTWLGNQNRTTESVAGEWPVSYHGTSQRGAKGIIRGHYKAGRRKRFGRGIYSTPDISIAEDFATEFTSKNGKRYKVILQNRINPKYRMICSFNKFWLTPIFEGIPNNSERQIAQMAIRPYGLLLKEV